MPIIEITIPIPDHIEVQIDGFKYEQIVNPDYGTCEVHDTARARWIVCGMQLCDACFDDPATRCPKCHYRSAGDYLDEHNGLTCQQCGFVRTIEIRGVIDAMELDEPYATEARKILRKSGAS